MGKIVLKLTDYHPEITIESKDNQESIGEVFVDLIIPALKASGFMDNTLSELEEIYGY